MKTYSVNTNLPVQCHCGARVQLLIDGENRFVGIMHDGEIFFVDPHSEG